MKPLMIPSSSVIARAIRWFSAWLAVFVLMAVAPPAPGAEVPTDGLSLWLKADAGVTLNGSNVAGWADQSPSGRDAIQTNEVSQPALITSGTGKPGLYFDGVDDFLTFNMPVNGLTGMTVVIVTSCRSLTGGNGASHAENAAIFWDETVSWGTVYIGPFQRSIKWRFGTTQNPNRQTFTRFTPITTEYTITSM
ncbi:MAG TPA: hypothetical protein P5022_08155, partial [Candidatus Paceibacterota bacterium]|nr:hypothetical protein [Candidatus Paceibacterota bacterium]